MMVIASFSSAGEGLWSKCRMGLLSHATHPAGGFVVITGAMLGILGLDRLFFGIRLPVTSGKAVASIPRPRFRGERPAIGPTLGINSVDYLCGIGNSANAQ